MALKERYPSFTKSDRELWSKVCAISLDRIREDVKVEYPELGKERILVVEEKYRQFLYLLARFPEESFAPTKIIDKLYWHAHILDTKTYRTDCRRLAGRFIDHCPHSMEGQDGKTMTRTKKRFREIFGESFETPRLPDRPAIVYVTEEERNAALCSGQCDGNY